MNWAVIVAAGKGLRMGAGVRKPYRPLGDILASAQVKKFFGQRYPFAHGVLAIVDTG